MGIHADPKRLAAFGPGDAQRVDNRLNESLLNGNNFGYKSGWYLL